MGEDSFLRGEGPFKINIEHGVQVYGEDGEAILDRDVATISASLYPKVGDVLVHPDGTFKLDAKFQDNGFNPRFILIKHTPDGTP